MAKQGLGLSTRLERGNVHPGQVFDLQSMPAPIVRDQTKAPHVGVDGAPPNFGQWVVPPIFTVQGRAGTVSKVYRPHDEALRHSRENARYMRNECSIMECLEARQRGTALLKWHLVPEDEKSPKQKELVIQLTKILERIPDFLEYRRVLLEALWYGRYAIQNQYRWTNIEGHLRVLPTRWLPLNGDKIVYRYDDLTGRYDDRQIGIRVGAGYQNGSWTSQRVVGEYMPKTEPTDQSLAYMLDEWERDLLVIHKHHVEDGDYEDPVGGGAIHGVGIRSRIYATWIQMMECQSYLMEYLERSAFGIEIWHYPMGSKEAHDAARTAAEERIGGGRSIILVPRPQGEDADLYGVEHIEPGLGGVDALKTIITDFLGHKIKRFILGQLLSSEAEATGMGSGVADLHLATYLDIVKYDAQKLGETLTRDLVNPIKEFNLPKARNVHVRLVIDTESAESEKKLQAYEGGWNMGLKLKAEDVYQVIGASAPDEDDEVLENPQFTQQQGGGMGMGMPGMDGPGGMPPMPGQDSPPSPDGSGAAAPSDPMSPGGSGVPMPEGLPPGPGGAPEQFASERTFRTGDAGAYDPWWTLEDSHKAYSRAAGTAEYRYRFGEAGLPGYGDADLRSCYRSLECSLQPERYAAWVEEQHPRESDGKFSESGGHKATPHDEEIGNQIRSELNRKGEAERGGYSARVINHPGGFGFTAELTHPDGSKELLGPDPTGSMDAASFKDSAADAAEWLSQQHLTGGVKEVPDGGQTHLHKTSDGRLIGYAFLTPGDIAVDPGRFQYKLDVDSKTGAGKELKEVGTYNPLFGGMPLVWFDKSDGKTYVINGHHRVELARRSGFEGVMPVMYVDAKTASEARMLGALTNIAEGRGTAIDAAKFLRESGLTLDDLRAYGLSLKGKTAENGVLLTQLNDKLFNLVSTKQMRESRALVIAEALPDHDLQNELLAEIKKGDEKSKGRGLSDGVVRQLADSYRDEPVIEDRQTDIFGSYIVKRSHRTEKATVQDGIQRRLAGAMASFAYGSSEKTKKRLESAGRNVVDLEENRRRKQQQAEILYHWKIEKNAKGVIGQAVQRASEDLYDAPADKKNIIERLYDNVIGLLTRQLQTEYTQAIPGIGAGANDGGRIAASRVAGGVEPSRYRGDGETKHGAGSGSRGIPASGGSASEPRAVGRLSGDRVAPSGGAVDDLEKYAGKWVPYTGPRGGKGWKNTSTGLVDYGDIEPGTGYPAKPEADKPETKGETMRLWRAADDDHISDSASFSEDRETAGVYLNNPGFGGATLYYADVDPTDVLDLTGDDAMNELMTAIDSDHDYGAIGADELVPRVADALCEAGYQWVRVRESYPTDTITWIYVGGVMGDEPELQTDMDDDPQQRYAWDESKHPRGKAGKFTATDTSIRDLPQQAHVQGGKIRVVSKAGRRTIGEHTFDRSEWDAASKHANPNWGQFDLLRRKLNEAGMIDDGTWQTNPDLIYDAQVGAIKKALAKEAAAAPPAATKPAAPAAKEPWQTRRADFVTEVRAGIRTFKQLGVNPTSIETLRGAFDFKTLDRQSTNNHRAEVTIAVAQGKPVPAEVLADYPDLKAKTPTGQTQEGLFGEVEQPKPTHHPDEFDDKRAQQGVMWTNLKDKARSPQGNFLEDGAMLFSRTMEVSDGAGALRMDDEIGNSYFLTASGSDWQTVVVDPSGAPVDQYMESGRGRAVGRAIDAGAVPMFIVTRELYARDGMRALFLMGAQ